jgi:hypothetical protein
MNWIIYILKNPRTGAVGYVGFTIRDLSARLKDHIKEAFRPAQTKKNRWFLSLLSIGLCPIIEAVESGTGDGWRDAESRWISHYLKQGARLTNSSMGGEGVPPAFTPEALSDRARKAYANLSDSQRKAFMRARWSGMTAEQRSIEARRHQAAKSPHQRQQQSEAVKRANARKAPEVRSAAVKKTMGCHDSRTAKFSSKTTDGTPSGTSHRYCTTLGQ